MEIMDKSTSTSDSTLRPNEEEYQKNDCWKIIESYFDNKHLQQLVRHQIDSYNDFIQTQMKKTIQIKFHWFDLKQTTIFPKQTIFFLSLSFRNKLYTQYQNNPKHISSFKTTCSYQNHRRTLSSGT
jgi:DNA-directed RNA polymerase beta subunit